MAAPGEKREVELTKEQLLRLEALKLAAAGNMGTNPENIVLKRAVAYADWLESGELP